MSRLSCYFGRLLIFNLLPLFIFNCAQPPCNDARFLKMSTFQFRNIKNQLYLHTKETFILFLFLSAVMQSNPADNVQRRTNQ
jgi:hypothetical protein